MSDSNRYNEFTDPESPHFAAVREAPLADALPAWEEVAAGRFMPRRIRGSNRGRALG